MAMSSSADRSGSPRPFCLAVLLLLPFLFLQAPQALGAPSQCPQFCFCVDHFVTCSDFSFLDLSMIPRSVETLVLTKGEVEEIPPAFLATAPNLKILELISVQVRIIRGSAFRGLNKLQLFTITGSTFDIVEPDSFSGISEVEKFEITDSTFGRVGKHAFGNIEDISEFYLWSNSFDRISAEAFLGLKNVRTFQIIRNNITRIGRRLFKDANSIETATVFDNKIGEISVGSFDTLAHVSNRMVFRKNVFLCSCELSWMLDKPVLDEFMDVNECVFASDNHMSHKDNTFHLSDMTKAVLCPLNISDANTPALKHIDTKNPFAVYPTGDENMIDVDDQYLDESNWFQPLAEQFEGFELGDFDFDDSTLNSDIFDGEVSLDDNLDIDHESIDGDSDDDDDGKFEADVSSDDNIEVGNGVIFETDILDGDDDEEKEFDEEASDDSAKFDAGPIFEDVVSDDSIEIEEDDKDGLFQETVSTEIYPELDESSDIVTSGDPYRPEEEWIYEETKYAQLGRENDNIKHASETGHSTYTTEQSKTEKYNLDIKDYVFEGNAYVDSRYTQEPKEEKKNALDTEGKPDPRTYAQSQELTTSSISMARISETTLNTQSLENTDSGLGSIDLSDVTEATRVFKSQVTASKVSSSPEDKEEEVQTLKPMTETFDLDTGHIFDYDFSFDTPSQPDHKEHRLWETITTRATAKPATRPTTATTMVFSSDDVVTLAAEEPADSQGWTRAGPDFNIGQWEPRQHGRAEPLNSPQSENENSSSSPVPKYLLSFVCLLACILARR